MANRSAFDKPFSDLLSIFSSPLMTSTQYKPWCQGRSFFRVEVDEEMLRDVDGIERGGLCSREDGGEDIGRFLGCSAGVDVELLGNQRGEDGGEVELAEDDALGGSPSGADGAHESTIIGDGERLANDERPAAALGLTRLCTGASG